jgi:adenylosuccinate lyase
MRRVWLALAEAQAEAGLVTPEQVADLRRTVEDVDLERAAEIEARTRHDVMAEILLWAEQAPLGGGSLHVGATSADITENADVIRMQEALEITQRRLGELIAALADRVDAHADQPAVSWTHLQPAAVTTVGYRLSVHLQDFLADLDMIQSVRSGLRGKGFKGAVGTRASYQLVLAGSAHDAAWLDDAASRALGLEPVAVCGQVVPRKQDWRVLTALAGIGGSAATFAFNIRLLQSPAFGEWSEGFAEGQVGSSVMPWKRNPIDAENTSSLARYLSTLPGVAWHNEECSLLERTLDDSANRRIVLPEAFLAADEILSRSLRMTTGLLVDERAIARNLDRFGPFAATEAVLMAAAREGGDRQLLHERIRVHSLEAWRQVEAGDANQLPELLRADHELSRWVDPVRIDHLMSEPAANVGDAPERARAMAATARSRVGL